MNEACHICTTLQRREESLNTSAPANSCAEMRVCRIWISHVTCAAMYVYIHIHRMSNVTHALICVYIYIYTHVHIHNKESSNTSAPAKSCAKMPHMNQPSHMCCFTHIHIEWAMSHMLLYIQIYIYIYIHINIYTYIYVNKYIIRNRQTRVHPPIPAQKCHIWMSHVT